MLALGHCAEVCTGVPSLALYLEILWRLYRGLDNTRYDFRENESDTPQLGVALTAQRCSVPAGGSSRQTDEKFCSRSLMERAGEVAKPPSVAQTEGRLVVITFLPEKEERQKRGGCFGKDGSREGCHSRSCGLGVAVVSIQGMCNL